MISDGKINTGISGKMEIQDLGDPVHSTRLIVIANSQESTTVISMLVNM